MYILLLRIIIHKQHKFCVLYYDHEDISPITMNVLSNFVFIFSKLIFISLNSHRKPQFCHASTSSRDWAESVVWTFLHPILSCPTVLLIICIYFLWLLFCLWEVRISCSAGIILVHSPVTHPSHLFHDLSSIIFFSWYSIWSFLLKLQKFGHPILK